MGKEIKKWDENNRLKDAVLGILYDVDNEVGKGKTLGELWREAKQDLIEEYKEEKKRDKDLDLDDFILEWTDNASSFIYEDLTKWVNKNIEIAKEYMDEVLDEYGKVEDNDSMKLIQMAQSLLLIDFARAVLGD